MGQREEGEDPACSPGNLVWGWWGVGTAPGWLDPCPSDSEVRTDYPGVWLECSFCFSRSGWALSI